MGEVHFRRSFGMPSRDTFNVAPIKAFVEKYLSGISIDPFARNNAWATYTNDLNPNTAAEHHMEADAFCNMLQTRGIVADVVLFDPPYSPRQISEVYRGIGRSVTKEDTQNAALYRRVRDALDALLRPGGIALSFGWNSNGMGTGRGYELVEIQLVAHGGGHNDTICIAERKATLTPGAVDAE